MDTLKPRPRSASAPVSAERESLKQIMNEPYSFSLGSTTKKLVVSQFRKLNVLLALTAARLPARIYQLTNNTKILA
jgi:hypothetical protein